MMTCTHCSLYALFAAFVLVLNTHALHVTKPEKEELRAVRTGGEHVFLRNHNRLEKKGAPDHRIMVLGADIDFGMDNVELPNHHVEKTGVASIYKLLKSALKYTQEVTAIPTSLDASHKKQGDFYIGSITNPCNYYVSLWSYNVETKTGQVRKELLIENDGEHYVSASDKKDTSEDIAVFREFANHIQGEMGVYTGRAAWGFVPAIGLGQDYSTRALSHDTVEDAKNQLKEFNTSQIDCWVTTETLALDLGVCLKLLAEQYQWRINYTAYYDTLNNLVADPPVHGECKDYYDEPTEKLIREKDELIFEKFRFDKCCDDGSKLASHLKHPSKRAPIQK